MIQDVLCRAVAVCLAVVGWVSLKGTQWWLGRHRGRVSFAINLVVDGPPCVRKAFIMRNLTHALDRVNSTVILDRLLAITGLRRIDVLLLINVILADKDRLCAYVLLGNYIITDLLVKVVKDVDSWRSVSVWYHLEVLGAFHDCIQHVASISRTYPRHRVSFFIIVLGMINYVNRVDRLVDVHLIFSFYALIVTCSDRHRIWFHRLEMMILQVLRSLVLASAFEVVFFSKD